MNLYQLIKQSKNVRKNDFIFNQIEKLTIKIYIHLRNICLCYYIKMQTPMCQRQFFRKFYQNQDYVENFYNNFNNPFHFACRQYILEK